MNIIYKLYRKLFWCYDMEKAPKDCSILAKLDHIGLDSECRLCVNSSTKTLCLYHAHGEGLSYDLAQYSVIRWGGAWDDRSYFEPNAGYMPDWWFRDDGDFETVANPVAWKLI